MSKSFRTSKSNKVIVGELTRLLSLGFENHIARIAIMYSIKKWEKSGDIILRDSKGKEYSSQILFGEYDDVYKVLIGIKHEISINDPKISQLIKFHLDRGLELLADELLEDDSDIYSLEEFLEKYCL